MSKITLDTTDMVSIGDAIRTKLDVETQYKAGEMPAAIQSIPSGGVIQPLTVSQNGTYTPPAGVDGYAPVAVNVSGGGGGGYVKIRVLYTPGQTVTATDGTTTMTGDTSGDYTFDISNVGTWVISDGIASKTIIVNVITANLVSLVYLSGYGRSSISQSSESMIGEYTLLVAAINCEASSYNLDLALSQNGTAVPGTSIYFQNYDIGSPSSTRNCRLMQYSVTLTGLDALTITCSRQSYYTEIIYVLTRKMNALTVAKVRTSNDMRIQDSFGGTTSCLALYGFINGSINDATINYNYVSAADVVDTGQGGTRFSAGYIFWLY